MIGTCDYCGGLYATEHLEVVAGRLCNCGMRANQVDLDKIKTVEDIVRVLKAMRAKINAGEHGDEIKDLLKPINYISGYTNKNITEIEPIDPNTPKVKRLVWDSKNNCYETPKEEGTSKYDKLF